MTRRGLWPQPKADSSLRCASLEMSGAAKVETARGPRDIIPSHRRGDRDLLSSVRTKELVSSAVRRNSVDRSSFPFIISWCPMYKVVTPQITKKVREVVTQT